MPITSLREIWCKNMQKIDSDFYNNLTKLSYSQFQGIRIIKLKNLMETIGFIEPTIDPRDILCFVEKCVDERFIYNRTLPPEAYLNPKVKFNYRQAIVDFGIPGTGCLYSDKESDIMSLKIAKFLKKNEIPVFISEAHEGCGAVQAKMKRDNQSEQGDFFASTLARLDAQSTAQKVKDFSTRIKYDVDVYSKFASMDDCYRVTNEEDQVTIARIHNGSGIIFLPNFFDKTKNSRLFLPDKFCLTNNVCMFNMLDGGEEMDCMDGVDLSPNSTARYIIFCLKLMLGQHGLGPDFFETNCPLTIIAACDNDDTSDVLRSYTIFKQLTELIEDDELLCEYTKIIDYIIIEY